MSQPSLSFTPEEEALIQQEYQALLQDYIASPHRKKTEIIDQAFRLACHAHGLVRRRSGEPYILHPIAVARIVCKEIGLGSTSICSALLHDVVEDTEYTVEDIRRGFGDKIAQIVEGLTKISTEQVPQNIDSLQAQNIRKLLLTIGDDARVILIKIADRLHNMRTLSSMKPEKQLKIAGETSFFYAPLADRLGLFSIKTELEDLSFRYEHPEAYEEILRKVRETEAGREDLFQRFAAPLKARLDSMELSYEMKTRVKGCFSIWRKMQLKGIPFEEVYDLFAVRIIFESNDGYPEKNRCWDIYTAITETYRNRPDRLRDWISTPKGNGYQALHLTVLGPDAQWIEVQIRSRRMDEIAEKGLAAHWRYKGIKGESGIDEWLSNIRAALENNDDLQLMDQFKMGLYEDEVFVFTPKGELLKFPKGANILDFAYRIHSGIGNKCVGGKINGKNVSFRAEMKSGDEVEVITQSNQTPKQEWVNIVKTPRAKAKIKLALKETIAKDTIYAKELLERRLKNRKIELDETTMMHLIKRMGFKVATDFYKQIADEKFDVNEVIEKYIAVRDYDQNINTPQTVRSATEFSYDNPDEEIARSNEDVLVIDRNLKGVDYSLAKCCQPIYGDEVFGFVTVSGGIKIHRCTCPNAPELRKRFGYRIVKARWSGKSAGQYSITIKVVGNDDLGIVNNITSIISKEEKIVMRSINIDSHDGLFDGTIVVQLEDVTKLEALMKKLRTVRGVKQVSRL